MNYVETPGRWLRLIDGLPKYDERVLVQVEECCGTGRMVKRIGWRTHTDANGEHWQVDALVSETRVMAEPKVCYWMPLP